MRTSIALLIAASVTVSACGGWKDSRANPRNWFGGSEEVELNLDAAAAVNPLLPAEEQSSVFARPEAVDESVLVASITGLRVERTSTGAIIYAEGLAAREGAYNVRLRPIPDAAEGTLAFQFRADYPVSQTSAGSEATRTVRAAYSLSDAGLDGIRTIRVESAQNAQETRR
jgi:hypothetical protein